MSTLDTTRRAYEQVPMTRVHLVGGEKGGVGKSVFARLLCQWFLDHSANLTALDGDLSQRALLRGYPECCRTVDLSAFESADQIMDLALGAEGEVVVDLPAQSLGQLSRWLAAGDVPGLAAEMNVRLVFWHVTDGGYDSARALETALSLLDPKVEVVVVCNQRWSHDFSHLKDAPVFQRLQMLGGRVIALPMLDAQVMFKTEGRGTSLAFARHEGQNGGELLTPMERRRAAHWLTMAYSQLGQILDVPPESQRRWGTQDDVPPGVTSEMVGETGSATDGLATPLSSEDAPSVESTGLQTGTELPEVQPVAPLNAPTAPAGAKWIDGAATWTEAGDNYLIHHVRCY